MQAQCTPHRLNVPGDFYTEDGACLSCGMPMTEAPDLFDYAPDGHCYVAKQPHSASEMDRMVRAFEVQDLQCIRYKGSDRVIQIRLVEAGEGNQCDSLPPDLADRNSVLQAAREARWAAYQAAKNPVRRSLPQRIMAWLRGRT